MGAANGGRVRSCELDWAVPLGCGVSDVGLFVLFVGTIYSQGGDAIGKMFDDTADAILKEQTAMEDAQIESVKTGIERIRTRWVSPRILSRFTKRRWRC